VVSSITPGKIAAGITGMIGTGSLGITVTGITRIASAHAAPTEIWAALAWLSTTTAAVAGLGMVLDHARAKLEIEARAGAVRLRADLEKARLAVYRALVEKSADAAGDAASYRELILADALHLAVELSKVQLESRTDGRPSRARIKVNRAPRETA
jgi:hypothetical protein